MKTNFLLNQNLFHCQTSFVKTKQISIKHSAPQSMKLNVSTPASRILQRLSRVRASLVLETPTGAPTFSRKSFLYRVTPATLAKIPAMTAAVMDPPKKRAARHELACRELKAFAFDPVRLLSAIAIECAASTLRTKAAVLGAVRPELKPITRQYELHGRKAMMTAEGKPKSARRFIISDFARIIPAAPPLVARALRVLWATAGRAVDLLHLSGEKVSSSKGVWWKITLLTRVEPSGALRAPKSDQKAKRWITKWIPARPGFEPNGLTSVKWKDLDPLMKLIGCTPHSIRQTAWKTLEDEGFTHLEIAMLSGHSVIREAVPAAMSYSARSPADPAATMSVRLSSILMSKLSF